MLKNPIKIVHTADIQIEVTSVHQRYDEYEFILRGIEKVISDEKPQLYAIIGDIFEKCKPTDTERRLFIDHLMRVRNLSHDLYIVITPGNHDTDQRKSANFYLSSGEVEPIPNPLEPIVTALNDDRIVLLDRSMAYPVIPGELLIWNWSQKTKHSECINEEYNPALNVSPTQFPGNPTCITFYHDPISGCKMFDDKELRGSEKSGTLDVFNTLSILAGDIHKPQIIQKANKTFIYCGSPVPRNFGEGDYYKDGRLYQNGMAEHAVNVVNLNPDGTLSNQKFVRIPQYRGYSTFIINTGVPFESLSFELSKIYQENFVNVKLPAATETYLSLEEPIIEAIRKDNPKLVHLNISFQYGKAITIDEDDVLSESDIHQLISEEQIVKVASDYIEKQVSLSRSIPIEDKEKCIKFINTLFIRELKNYISNIPSNKIELLSIDISNFMAFGEQVHLNLSDVHDLIKLTGGNGVGKTTFYNSLKWVITGYISNSQNRTKKNENNILVFNDYRWDTDDMGVRLKIRLNGNVYTITRTAHRDWKKNITPVQKQSKNWRSYIANTTSSIKVESVVLETPKKDDEAEVFLESIFGGLTNLNSIVFPSQFTLRTVVNSDPAKLCEDILRNIGMSFFDGMYDKYDSVRNEIMSKLSKPDKSVDQLIQIITDKTNLLDETSEYINNHETILSKQETLREQLNSELLSEKQKLYPDGLQSKIDSLKLDAEAVENNITEETKQYETRKLGFETILKGVDIELSRKRKSELEASIEETRTLISSDSTQELELNQNLNKILESINAENEVIRNQVSGEVQKLTSDRDKLYKENEELNSQLTEYRLKYQTLRTNCINLFTKKINEASQSAAFKKSEIESYERQLSDFANRISELQNSKVCPSCGRVLSDEHLEHIKTKIDELEKQKADVQTIINNLEKECDNFITQQKEYETKYQDFLANPDTVEALGCIRLNTESLEKRISGVLENIQKLAQEISVIQNSTETRIKESETIKKLREEYNGIYDNIHEVQQTRAKHNLELDKLTNALSEITQIITEYESNLKLYEETEHNWKLRSLELQNEKKQIDADIVRATEHLEANRRINEVIAKLESDISATDTSINSLKESLLRSKTSAGVLEHEISELNIQKISAVKYRIAEASLKQYKALIGKTGLPQHIFSIIRGVLNSKLNDLLEDMDFRLIFDESNNLIMVDLSKPGHPVRRPAQLSGMQTCFTGLALIYVNRMCNNTFIFDSLFIDEVSGQLNSGTELTYESQNYQEQLKKLLRKFANLKIWIVDHVIEDLNENFRFEVVPSNSGATIISR